MSETLVGVVLLGAAMFGLGGLVVGWWFGEWEPEEDEAFRWIAVRWYIESRFGVQPIALVLRWVWVH